MTLTVIVSWRVRTFSHWLSITHSETSQTHLFRKGMQNAVSAYQKQQAEQSPQREVASTSAIKDENRDVKPPTKKRKIEVDTDYSYDDDDDDDESQGSFVGSDSTTNDNDEPTPNLGWVFHPK